MTTDAWKALKRRRRRWICRRIRRTFFWTAWSLIAAVFVGHVVWFRYGWMDLPVRCVDAEWREWRLISGSLQPHAAASFEILLKTLYGDAAVKRVSTERIWVRPAVVLFYDDNRLDDLGILLTERFSIDHRYQAIPSDSAKECRFVQHYLMAGGLAADCDDSWAPYIYGRIRQDTWPSMTRFFRVEQPSPGQMHNLPWDDLPWRMGSTRNLAAPTELSKLGCGPPAAHQIMYAPVVVVAEVAGFLCSLWPFQCFQSDDD